MLEEERCISLSFRSRSDFVEALRENNRDEVGAQRSKGERDDRMIGKQSTSQPRCQCRNTWKREAVCM